MLLSACLGATVTRGERHVGTLVDLGAAPRGRHPVVEGVVVEHGRRRAWATWSEVVELTPHAVVLAPAARLVAPPDTVLLARDVLDAQLVDVSGRRVVRVGDVDLRVEQGLLHVVGVEAGLDSVLRRLGLRALAQRAPRHRIAWGEVHLPAHPGSALTVQSAAPALERMTPHERARIASRLAPRAAAALRVPRHLVRHRYPTHALRRRRASS